MSAMGVLVLVSEMWLRHVRFFDRSREWYGFVRGSQSEKILSFHPADPSCISANGANMRFVLNAKLLAAKIIRWEDK